MLFAIACSLALAGDPVGDPPDALHSVEYRKRAYVVNESDGEWGVYRVWDDKPVSARTFAHVTDDEPLKSRLRNARVRSYVGAGLLAGTGVVLAYSALMISVQSVYFDRPNAGTYTALTALGAAGCVAGATLIPIVTFKRQSDIHTFYDEDRARGVVEGYDKRLRRQYGVSASLDVVASPTAVGLAGVF